MPLGISDNLFQRIVSALLLLPPVLWVIYAGGWWFTGLLGLGGVLMILEWCALTGVKNRLVRILAAAVVVALVLAVQLTAGVFVGAGLIALLGLALSGAILLRLKADAPLGWWLAGVAYVGLPIVSLWWIRDVGAMMVFWVFLSVWAMDVGGYFAGKGIGGPKLAPKISPKKTWAGLIGGVALSMLVSAALHYGFGFAEHPLLLVLLSGFLAFWSQVGDLLESGIKRHFGVKDSGGLIPGHGGLLDRVDGLVFAAPAVVLALLLLAAFGQVL